MKTIIILGLLMTLNSLHAQILITLTLDAAEKVYCWKNKQQVLTYVKTLPRGTQIQLPENSSAEILPLENGRRDTSGFYSHVDIKDQALPSSCLRENKFYITGTIPLGLTDFISPIPLQSQADERFKEYFIEGTGQIKRSKVGSAIKKNSVRFQSLWNKEYAPGDLSQEDLIKSQSILRELQKAADRTQETNSSYLFLSTKSRNIVKPLAEKLSRQTLSNYGFSASYGAWDVALVGTANRLGFGHAPCAEFVSEIIRQAYTRAGYDFSEDFHSDVDHRLIYTWNVGEEVWGPQSVRGLTDRLLAAGWVPWDPTLYRPLTGSIGSAWYATTPGHTYVMAGLDGQFVVDNGNPKGLNLRRTTERHSKNQLKNMYIHGVFFLPPGITPAKW